MAETKKIDEMLAGIGIPTHHKGFLYLREAINLISRDPQMINSLTKLYPTIAEKFNTQPHKVERIIRHAIFEGNRDADERPTNAEFMALIADKID